MIKRILTPDECDLVAKDVFPILEEKYQWYIDSKRPERKADLESIISFTKEAISSGTVVIYTNKEKEKYNALAIFSVERNMISNKIFLCEVIFWSDEPKVGFEIFKEACKFGKSFDCEYITLGSLERNPDKEKYEKVLKYKGFVKESSFFSLDL